MTGVLEQPSVHALTLVSPDIFATCRKVFSEMAHIVAQPCVGCRYTDCVVVCPVECFYEGEKMLYIQVQKDISDNCELIGFEVAPARPETSIAATPVHQTAPFNLAPLQPAT
jgi:NAD-dependent dihydropyrimidine dehydrogenase PreA subunit